MAARKFHIPYRAYRYTGYLLAAILVLTVFFFLFLERVIPYAIDMAAIKYTIEQSIQEGTGIRADIRELSVKITMLDGVQVLFDNNVLYDPTGLEIADAGQVVVNVRLLPLLSRRTSVSKITFTNIAVVMDEKGFQYQVKKPETAEKTVLLEDTTIELNNYRIMVDRFFDGKNKYLLHGDYLSLGHFNSKKPLTLEGQGTGFFGHKAADERIGRFKLAIRANQRIVRGSRFNWKDVYLFQLAINNVELPTLGHIVSAYGLPVNASGKVGQLQLTYNGEDYPSTLTLIGNTAADTKIELPPYRFEFDPGKLTFTTKLDMNPESKWATLSDLVLTLANPDFQGIIKGDLHLKMPFEQSRMNLAIRTSPLSLTGLDVLPVLSPAQRQLLGGIDGTFASDMQVSGSPQKPDVKGLVRLNNLAVKAENGDFLIRNLDGRLRMLSTNRMVLEQLRGIVADSPLNAKGLLDLETKRLEGQLSAPRINLHKLQQIARIFNPHNAALGAFVLSGRSGVDLQARGTLDDPQLHGQFQLGPAHLVDARNGQVLLQQVTGKFNLTGDRIVIPGLAGYVGQNPIQVAGWLRQDRTNSDLRVRAPRLDLASAQATAQMLTALAGQPPEILRQITLVGSAVVDMRLMGNLSAPRIQGEARLNGANVTYHPMNATFRSLTGHIGMTPDVIRVNSVRGHFRQIPFTLGGTVNPDFKHYQLRLNTPELAIATFQSLIAEFAPEVNNQLRQAGIQSGMVRLALQLSPSFNRGVGGIVHLRNLVANPAMLGQPVYIAQLRYDIGQERLEIPRGLTTVGRLKLQTWGYVAGSNYNLNLIADRLPVSYFREERAFLQRFVPTLPTVYNTAGAVNIVANVQPQRYKAQIDFLNAGASMKELKFPVYNVNGRLALTTGNTFQAQTNNLRFRYANSLAEVHVTMSSPRHIRATVNGEASPLLLNDLVNGNRSPVFTASTLPFDAALSGIIGQLSGRGQGNNLSLTARLNPGGLFSNQPVVHPVALEPVPHQEPVITAALRLVNDTLDIDHILAHVSENNGAVLTGQVQHVFMPELAKTALSFATSPVLDLDETARAFHVAEDDTLAGQLKGHVNWFSEPGRNHAEGHLAFEGVKSAFLQINNLDGVVKLFGTQLNLAIDNLQIPGLDTGLTAMIPDIRIQPMPVETFDMQGTLLNIDQVSHWAEEVLNNRVAELMAQLPFAPASAGPSNEAAGRLPFEIMGGTAAMGEVVLNNIRLDEVQAMVRMTADRTFGLNNLNAKIADGEVDGVFAMAPLWNNRMLAQLRLDDIEASALVKMMTDSPSQIFGKMDGFIDLTTEGDTPQEMLANATGGGELYIEKGRLPQVARLETMLLAVSEITGNLTSGDFSGFSLRNLNWGSLARLATRYRTDYFATMAGSFTLNQGLLHTDDLLVDGQNLDFQVKGDLRLTDNHANLTVRGQFDRELGSGLGTISNSLFGRSFRMSGPLRSLLEFTGVGKRLNKGDALAAIGSLTGAYEVYNLFRGGFDFKPKNIVRLSSTLSSIRFLRFIPGFNNLIGRIPGIGFVPGINLPMRNDWLVFEVDIIGPLNSGKSIKNLRWVRDSKDWQSP